MFILEGSHWLQSKTGDADSERMSSRQGVREMLSPNVLQARGEMGCAWVEEGMNSKGCP